MEEEIVRICEKVVGEIDNVRHNYDINTKLNIESGIDSLALMNILIEIENAYGINLDEYMEEVSRALTIGDIVKIIDNVCYGNNIALVDDKGLSISYKNLKCLSDEFGKCVPKRSVVIIIATNTIESIVGYVACMKNRVVPLILNSKANEEDIVKYIKEFEANYIWKPRINNEKTKESLFSYNRYTLCKISDKTLSINNELALLLTTSGSTGSRKLVRISYKNVESNTKNICKYLKIMPEDIAITSLPMNYTYGLSVINTHLLSHAKLVVTEHMPYSGEFWNILKKYNVTFFAGVPYTYEMLRNMGFAGMTIDSLRTLTVAGGKIRKIEEEYYIDYAINNGKKFIVMYGQTEATARISYRPTEVMKEKIGSVGIAIPEGRMWLENSEGEEIKNPFVNGEIVYSGENVSMGYAYSVDDLSKGYEWGNTLHTGDIGYKDEDGYFYISERKDNTIKINGIRVDLSDVEQILREKYVDSEFRCEMKKCPNEVISKKIKICVEEDERLEEDKVLNFISERMGISPKCFLIEKF
jgi:acyl-coenzyme A synthetase/AMP-(fatty) acid ligase/acyl carrier protein